MVVTAECAAGVEATATTEEARRHPSRCGRERSSQGSRRKIDSNHEPKLLRHNSPSHPLSAPCCCSPSLNSACDNSSHLFINCLSKYTIVMSSQPALLTTCPRKLTDIFGPVGFRTGDESAITPVLNMNSIEPSASLLEHAEFKNMHQLVWQLLM